jgi:HIRAN domain-containing protein
LLPSEREAHHAIDPASFDARPSPLGPSRSRSSRGRRHIAQTGAVECNARYRAAQHIRGSTAYYDAEHAHAALTQSEDLILRRQPDNRFDGKAIEVFARNGSKLGYVPRSDNSALSALMDDGRRLRARITALHPSRFRDIGMAVALVERA